MQQNNKLVQGVVGLAGFFYLLTGGALLFIPDWFFANIGFFPPFNRHYAGDLGAFHLPLGLFLLMAARHPAQHRSLIGFAAAGSLVHAFNHLYDTLMGPAPAWGEVVLLLVFGAMLALVYIGKRNTGNGETV